MSVSPNLLFLGLAFAAVVKVPILALAARLAGPLSYKLHCLDDSALLPQHLRGSRERLSCLTS